MSQELKVWLGEIGKNIVDSREKRIGTGGRSPWTEY